MRSSSKIDALTFLEDAPRPSSDTFVAVMPLEIEGFDRLMSALAEALKFPNYFGRNWNAVSDLLGDLSWLQQRRIVLWHETLPRLKTEDLGLYADVLGHCRESWKPEEGHEFVPAFQTGLEKELQSAHRVIASVS